ncbi:BMC domain-containing protein [Virgibacillus byunsanensis]|uniref:BMC domain-containing protein n=1 Tax=Virgibacillus byunsanensis TaxID=570945 RepID=A0ABW3LPB9_9BACI
MNVKALGLIETIGYTTAVTAADAAVKAADVEIIGMEKVIGVRGYVGVTIHLTGDVAAVTSAVEAGKEQAELVGELISTEVIPRLHSDVDEKLLSKFLLKNEPKPKKKTTAKKKASSNETKPKAQAEKTKAKQNDPAAKSKPNPSLEEQAGESDENDGKKA